MVQAIAQVGALGWVTLALGLMAVGAAVLHAVLARRPSFAAALVFLSLGLAAAILGTLVGMQRTYAAVAFVDPSQKASLLARGISESMNCAVFGAAALLLWVAPFVIGEIRRHK